MSRLLVIAETDGDRILDATLPSIAFAQQWTAASGGRWDLLLIGGDPAVWSAYGASRVCHVTGIEHPTADAVATVINGQLGPEDSVAGTASTFGRDCLARIAGAANLPMLSDVMSVESVEGRLRFRRPMYAGNVIATVEVDGGAAVYSVRGTAFDAPQPGASQSEVVNIAAADLPTGTHWVGLDAPEQKRPELTSARVIVSGGRPLRDSETFERLIGGLADKLGGAVGATRAAVDSGIAPNEMQVGQTGKTVAPELYIAAGISGSVQHLAGMKDSKVIVAINTDPDAPIYEVADFGLVQDLHTAIPELLDRL